MGARKVVAVSGYFDPLHIGHVRYLQAAKRLGDKLVVILNNDGQARLKKGAPFMLERERREILQALRCVDDVILSIDTDRTVRETLKIVRPDIFAKGGDSTGENTPEQDVCDEIGCIVFFGVGGEKIQSSSWLTSGSSA